MQVKHKVAEACFRYLILGMVVCLPCYWIFKMVSAIDNDIWWHMAAGKWMMVHHALPLMDPFSIVSKPWQEYSWLFDLIAYGFYQHGALVGIQALTMTMAALLAATLLHLTLRIQKDLTIAVLLTFAVLFCMGPLFTPRPWLLTIIFFVVELDVLLKARKVGVNAELLLLPAVFALWANIHIQFIDGLFPLCVLVAESALAPYWNRKIARPEFRMKTRLCLPAAVGVFTACFAAIFVNPFGARIFRIAWDLASQKSAMALISELQAIPFRGLGDYLLLFLVFASIAALAWQKRVAFFETGLLLLGALLSFRSIRDCWFVLILALIILAQSIPGRDDAAIHVPIYAWPAILAVGAGILFVAGQLSGLSNASLQARLQQTMPVQATNFIRTQGYSGPLFNHFDWGGYLIWNQTLPVEIDGRAALHGDEEIYRSLKSWTLDAEWNQNPSLGRARVLIAQRQQPLTQMLRLDPRFRKVYEDQVAVVFVASSIKP